MFIEPAVPTPQLIIVGRSPMATTLADLATALGWRAEVVDGADFSAADVDGPVDRHRRDPGPRRRGGRRAGGLGRTRRSSGWSLRAAGPRRVLGYLADRGVPQHLLDRVHAPVGLDLGHTSHREIAVAILAELVRERAAGGLVPAGPHTGRGSTAPAASGATEAVDPVCGMTVRADQTSPRSTTTASRTPSAAWGAGTPSWRPGVVPHAGTVTQEA